MRMPTISTRKFIALRKLTRTLAETLRSDLRSTLITIEPLLRPRTVFGEHVQGHGKELVKGSDRAFKDLATDYAEVAGSKPFHIPKELKSPFEVMSVALEMQPVEYAYNARSDRDSKTVKITSPLKWVVNYHDYGLENLKRVLADRNRTEEQLRRFVVHFLLVEHVFTRQPGIKDMLAALRFPVVVERRPEFGSLPITCITTAVSTYRPDDAVIIETTEISGSEEFEEFVKVSDISDLRDAYHDKLVEILRAQDTDLLDEA
jgi:hypothetical protein